MSPVEVMNGNDRAATPAAIDAVSNSRVLRPWAAATCLVLRPPGGLALFMKTPILGHRLCQAYVASAEIILAALRLQLIETAHNPSVAGSFAVGLGGSGAKLVEG